MKQKKVRFLAGVMVAVLAFSGQVWAGESLVKINVYLQTQETQETQEREVDRRDHAAVSVSYNVWVEEDEVVAEEPRSHEEPTASSEGRHFIDESDAGSLYVVGRTNYNRYFTPVRDHKIENGVGFQIGLGYEFDENIDLEATLDWNSSDVVPTPTNDTTIRGVFKTNGININGRYYISETAYFDIWPYIEAGFGVFKADLDLEKSDGRDGRVPEQSFGIKGSNWMLGYHLGIGGVYQLGDSLSIEGGYRRTGLRESIRAVGEDEQGEGDGSTEAVEFKHLKSHGIFVGARYIW